MARPIVKWAGGKSKILKDLRKYFPKSFGKYVEPFLGGGSVYFSLMPGKAILSDSNKDLMTTYKVVREDVNSLIEYMKTYQNTPEFFYGIRKAVPKSDLEVAANFLFLNKTCFNGLYRVNKAGEFNVPFGSYKNPNLCDAGNLKLASKALHGASLLSGDFEDVLRLISKEDFVYMDPPYVATFNDYSRDGFNMDCQERLAKAFEVLPCKGILSNSDEPWVRERYKDFTIIEIKSARSINSKGDGRGKVSELIIKNY
jgi:DNA adenine methylase